MLLTEKSGKDEKLNKKDKKPLNAVEGKKNKFKKKAKQMDPAEERAMKELNKVAAYQARLAKKNNKQKKIRAIVENSDKLNQQPAGIY